MGLFGKILGTALDVATSPIAVLKDVIPGGGGYIDGNPSHTADKLEEISEDFREVRDGVEEI